MAEDGLLAEMHALRDRVTGVTGSALASRDGLIIKADTEVNEDNLAALAATSLGLAQRMAREVGQGALREAITRSSGGARVSVISAKVCCLPEGGVARSRSIPGNGPSSMRPSASVSRVSSTGVRTA